MTGPVSGHRPPVVGGVSAADAPEHDWTAASARLFPVLRPIGTSGTQLSSLVGERMATEGMRPHVEPLVDPGPAGIPISWALRAESYDVLISADHLIGWGVAPDELRRTALENLTLWSEQAAWTDEVSGHRRLVSSDTGEGGDAVRILVPECRRHLRVELGTGARVLVGLPERHLLVAGSLLPGDDEFATLFAQFVAEQAAGADEPIDGRVFELVDDDLRPFEA